MSSPNRPSPILPPSRARRRVVVAIAAACALGGLAAAGLAWGLGPPVRAGMESRYVHRIKLYDAEDRALTAASREPYSPRHTCGKCHDVERIASGSHFRSESSADDGRAGEPWILVDPPTATQMPLVRPHADPLRTPPDRLPSEIGMTDWEFALRFGRHHPGGGPLDWWRGKPKGAAEEPAPPGGPAVVDATRPQRPRWRVAGSLDIDCLLCHSSVLPETEARWNRIRDYGFRWAPTAGAGLGPVQGSVDEFLAEQEEEAGDAKPGAPEPKPPVTVRYDPARFDPEGRVLLDITRRPPARNCLFCHATRVPGDNAGGSAHRDRDVHLVAGLACTDCHRNDLGHRITRGDGGAEDLARHPDNATLSCRGCHASGRLGSPEIAHAGLPAFHLERIACTACHSGPPARAGAVPLLQTARAHALGLLTKEDLDRRTLPAVQAPVFRRDADGVIRPYAALWPAWWGERRGATVAPIPLLRVREALGKPAPAPAAEGAAPAWPSIDVAAVLQRLRKPDGGEPVYVAGGRVYSGGAGGALQSAEAPEAAPRFWPLPHDVRPARQALGAGGCSDCHASRSAFFSGALTAAPAGPDGRAVSVPMRDLLDEPKAAVRLGAAAVKMREAVTRRLPVWIAAAIVGLTFLHFFARRSRVSPEASTAASTTPLPALGPFVSWVHAAAFGLFLVLAVTAAGFVLTYGPSPTPGFFGSRSAVHLHAASGLAFAVVALALVACWVRIGVAGGRGADWIRRWGGFLWMKPRAPDACGCAGRRVWVWLDATCCVALAASGIVMALRVPAVAAAAGAGLAHVVERPALTAAAYAAHGLAGTVLMVRFAAHLYGRFCGTGKG